VITVRLPEPLRNGRADVITMSATSLADVIAKLGIEEDRDELYNFAINGELIIHGEKKVKLDDGDEVEIVVAFSGG
jgi:sulfur carrier protein ThiS